MCRSIDTKAFPENLQAIILTDWFTKQFLTKRDGYIVPQGPFVVKSPEHFLKNYLRSLNISLNLSVLNAGCAETVLSVKQPFYVHNHNAQNIF